jgi:hypothetical protein
MIILYSFVALIVKSHEDKAMKLLNTVILIIIFVSSLGCTEQFPVDTKLITKDQENAELKSTPIVPTADYIDLADDGFEAFVFYDSIMGVDGIASLTNNSLLVVQEWGDPGKCVFLIEKGHTFNINDAFTPIGYPFISPDDIIIYSDGTAYVADGQAQTVFKISKDGGAPVPLVTPSNTRASFNPFGLAIAPANYDGPNVDPGDIIVADNAYGSIEKAVWAVNPISGVAKIIAEGNVFVDGPILVDFALDGTLFVNQNTDSGSGRIVTLSANGTVTPFYGPIFTNPSLAVNPRTNEVFFKRSSGTIYRIPLAGGTPQLFASNIGRFQDIAFNAQGTALYLCDRTKNQIIEISAATEVWEKF